MRLIYSLFLFLILNNSYAQKHIKPPHETKKHEVFSHTTASKKADNTRKDAIDEVIESLFKNPKNNRLTREGEEFLLEINNKVRVKSSDYKNLRYIISNLSQKKTNLNNYKIICLIEDRATKKQLKSKFSNDKIVSSDFKNIKEIKAKLIQNKNSIIHLIGHVENDCFIIEKNKIQLKIPIEEIQNFQIENGLEIYYSGCESALNGAGTGFLEPINSIDIIENIRRAHSGTEKAYLDYLTDLAGDYSLIIGYETIQGSLCIVTRQTKEKEDAQKEQEELIKNSSKYKIINIQPIDTTFFDSEKSEDPVASILKDNEANTESGFATAFRVVSTIVFLFLFLFGGFYIYNKINKIE